MFLLMSGLAALLVTVTLALLVNGARQHPAVVHRRRFIDRRADADAAAAWRSRGSVERRRKGRDPRRG